MRGKHAQSLDPRLAFAGPPKGQRSRHVRMIEQVAPWAGARLVLGAGEKGYARATVAPEA